MFEDFSNSLPYTYIGTIEKVYAPDDPQNQTAGYQYQYRVVLSIDNMAQTRVMCVRKDTFGGIDDYEDLILEAGIRVYVNFPLRSVLMGVIIGQPRGFLKAQKSGERYYEKRFGLVTERITKSEGISITHDSGNVVKITPDKIVISDGQTETITIDMTSRKITVEAGKFDLNVVGDANIKVGGDTTVQSKNVDVKCKKATLLCDTLEANVVKEANVTCAMGDVNVVGRTINLNGAEGDVITTATQPTCYVTGIPFNGAKTVKAGL